MSTKPTRRSLSVVPPAPARVRAEIEDLDEDDARVWLRRMSATATDLCDAVDNFLGPERPAPRPQLTIIPGGKDVSR